ncbi:MAG TPA: competence/damage-inducible protein A [Candidatus Kapabacteria bacterium]|nr:competence/damage-inducible protein A [Candidatus Kapabacteria bacterium]
MAVRAELISIGDELLIGQVINTNASTLSKALNSTGIRVVRITTVGDDRDAILHSFDRAWNENDVVIVTGGLGPTHDDISKATVSEFFNVPLEFHEEIYEKVRQRFERLGVKRMPETNRSQAMVPKGFIPLRNDVGTAPGLVFKTHGKLFAILAGVPHEMEFILKDSLLDLLHSHFEGQGLEAIIHRTLITAGIGESMLAEKLGDVDALLRGEATLAFLPRSTGVRLRLTAINNSRAKVEDTLYRITKEMYDRIGMHIVGQDDASISESIVRLLEERKETLAVAESCTGGMIGAAITDVPGSSSVFDGGVISYSNEVKQLHLDVPQELLERYGAVSLECAEVMAEKAREKFGSTYALSVTGIAGPGGGTETKPVGLVYVGLAQEGQQTVARKFQFIEDRKINRERSVASALEMLRRRLTGQEDLYKLSDNSR